MASRLIRLEHLAFNAVGDTVKASSLISVSLPTGRDTGFAKAIILSEAVALKVTMPESTRLLPFPIIDVAFETDFIFYSASLSRAE